ncbi:MAG: DUF2878 domain-containing protein [bacterium]|nr:DUF2878 domain-containing protein [bacterium]
MNHRSKSTVTPSPTHASARVDQWLNAMGYLLVWWIAVLGAAQGYAFVGPIAAIAMLLWHILSKTIQKKEWPFLLKTVFFGTLFDTFFSFTGLIQYQSGYSHFPFLAPLWISALWLGFSMTIFHSFRTWLSNPLIAIGLGGIGGPLSYLGAERLGAVVIQQPMVTIPLLIVGWAGIFFLFHRSIHKRDG